MENTNEDSGFIQPIPLSSEDAQNLNQACGQNTSDSEKETKRPKKDNQHENGNPQREIAYSPQPHQLEQIAFSLQPPQREIAFSPQPPQSEIAFSPQPALEYRDTSASENVDEPNCSKPLSLNPSEGSSTSEGNVDKDRKPLQLLWENVEDRLRVSKYEAYDSRSDYSSDEDDIQPECKDLTTFTVWHDSD